MSQGKSSLQLSFKVANVSDSSPVSETFWYLHKVPNSKKTVDNVSL